MQLRHDGDRSRSAVGAAVAWLAIVACGVVAGGHYAARHRDIGLDAAPFAGTWSLSSVWRILPAALIGCAAVSGAARLGRHLRWRRLLVVAMAANVTWTVLLTVSRSFDDLTRPFETRFDYLAAVPLVGQPHRFVSTFTEQWSRYPTHVKGHPPGFVLLLWLLHHAGLGGPNAEASIVSLLGSTTVAAVLVATRNVVHESAARRAAPFLVFAPAVIWASSADFLFASVAAWAVASFALASSARGARSALHAVVSGVLWAAGLLLSYGLLPLSLVVAVVGTYRRRADTMAITAITVVAAFLLVRAYGFWWPDGLRATHRAYLAGIAPSRPYPVFLLLGVAAFIAALGPAALPALALARGRTTWLLCGAAIAAVVAADLSGLSKGEVERIWLPFAPWIIVAAGTTSLSDRANKAWLAAQIAYACGLQLMLRSPW